MKKKYLCMAIMLVLAIATMINPAMAAKQLEGNTTITGPKYGYTFADQRAGADFKDIYVCEKFRLYAISDASQSNTYIQCNIYERTTQNGSNKRLASAEFKNNLVAAKNNWFPSSSTYKTVVNTGTPFDIRSGYYYKTMLYENAPSSIRGYYYGWISNSSSGN